MLRAKQTTSAELVKIYAHQIHKYEKLNLYADADFELSLKLAIEKDKMALNKSQKDLPPLHGLPMSFKDHV